MKQGKDILAIKILLEEINLFTRQNKNGDIVLNKAISGTVSFDTPRRFINEFSNERINKNI